ncbi:MAG: acyl carrier protein [Bacteroidota bacterium]
MNDIALTQPDGSPLAEICRPPAAYLDNPDLADDSEAMDAAAREANIRLKVRRYIIEDCLLGTTEEVDDAASLSRNGILDSTGALELVAFLEEEFIIVIADQDLIPENLDSIDGIVALVETKLAFQRRAGA